MDFFSVENLAAMIKAVGYLGLFAIVFAESGLLIGFFLPGDSLIFTAGVLASQGYLDIVFLIPLLWLAAVLGDNAGYHFGEHIGPKIFTKTDSLFFHRAHLERARLFYAAHGSKTLILARFMPVIRTFAPILAGVGKMPYQSFLTYNLLGGALWTVSLPLAGFWLGTAIPDIDRYLLPIILLIIFLSFLPAIIHLLKSKRTRRSFTSAD